MQTLRKILHQPWFQEGRLNGFAELTTTAEGILEALGREHFETSVSTYPATAPPIEWLRDDRLRVLLSHETRAHMPSDLHRYFFAALYAQMHGHTPKLRHFPASLLPDHKNVEKGKSQRVF
ncbi:MAG: hypothetical protein IPK19_27970 [Chloroflexi bacterium]|nr:hypothetical protein [Chloroflexota bacterium]